MHEIQQDFCIIEGPVPTSAAEAEPIDNTVEVMSSMAGEEHPRKAGRAEAPGGENAAFPFELLQEPIIEARVVSHEDGAVEQSQQFVLYVPEDRRSPNITVRDTGELFYVAGDGSLRIDECGVFLDYLAVAHPEDRDFYDPVIARVYSGCLKVDDGEFEVIRTRTEPRT